MGQKFKKGDVEKGVNRQSGTSRKKNSSIVAILCFILGIITGIVMGEIIAVVILDKDSNDNAKKPSNVETEQQIGQAISTLEEMLEAEGLVIKTPIVDLRYPVKWKEQIRTEQVEGDAYTVQFFGVVDGKEEVQLFNIVFGETEGISLGTIEGTEVCLVYVDIEFDASWTEEEQNEIYAMQEDVNYIIGMFQKEEGYIPASKN